jgi:hypothetical protein
MTNPFVPLKLLRILIVSQLLRVTNVCELMHILAILALFYIKSGPGVSTPQAQPASQYAHPLHGFFVLRLKTSRNLLARPQSMSFHKKNKVQPAARSSTTCRARSSAYLKESFQENHKTNKQQMRKIYLYIESPLFG